MNRGVKEPRQIITGRTDALISTRPVVQWVLLNARQSLMHFAQSTVKPVDSRDKSLQSLLLYIRGIYIWGPWDGGGQVERQYRRGCLWCSVPTSLNLCSSWGGACHHHIKYSHSRTDHPPRTDDCSRAQDKGQEAEFTWQENQCHKQWILHGSKHQTQNWVSCKLRTYFGDSSTHPIRSSK